jgi:hypothetical protein
VGNQRFERNWIGFVGALLAGVVILLLGLHVWKSQLGEKIALSLPTVSDTQCKRIEEYLRLGAYADYEFAGESLLKRSIKIGNACATRALIGQGATTSDLEVNERIKLALLLEGKS